MAAKQQGTEHKLLEPYLYVKGLPGKNVRGKLISAFRVWVDVPTDVVEEITTIIDELHNASLLIDDIEDDSELRRGKPVAHHIYGVPATINSANYVYFLALQRCYALKNDKAMQVYIQEILRLHEGQGLDIYWRDNLQCPTIEEYIAMVQNKTGGLFRLAVGLMQAFGTSTQDFKPLINALSVYFQIRDDYINLFDDDYMINKTYCEDLSEGKFSYPLIIGIREHPQDTRLINILKQRTKSIELKKCTVDYLRETGASEHTLMKLNELYQEITQEIEALGGNEPLSNIMDALNSTLQKNQASKM